MPEVSSNFVKGKEEISVVMPARNAEAFIGQALASIIGQTRRPAEIIVVDDGSTDRTRDIVEAQAANCDIPMQIVEGPRQGVAAAHNAGLKQASSPWIAIMHADDVARRDRFELQMAAARSLPEVLVWGAYGFHVDRNGDVKGLSATGPTNLAEFRQTFHRGQVTGNIIHSSALYRRATIEELGGYNTDFNGAEDLELFERVAERGPVLALTEPLVYRRIHANSVTSCSFRRVQLLKRYIEARTARRVSSDQALPDLADFLEETRYLARPTQVAAAARDFGEYLYHCAGLRFSAGHRLMTLGYFAAAVACHPTYTLRRAVRQLGGRRAKAGTATGFHPIIN